MEGQIGILPGHVSMVSALKLGLLKIIMADGTEEKIVINNGLLVVNKNEVNILAEMANSLVNEQIEVAIHDAEEKLATTLPPNELIELEKQLRYERFKKKLHEQ
jgi:F-type H+-transporting ATPase subunit epsilon